MQIVRGRQSSRHREWTVTANGRSYRVTNYWSIGDLRMTWLVEVEVSPPQVQTHWRRIEGRSIIDAVREYENAAPAATT